MKKAGSFLFDNKLKWKGKGLGILSSQTPAETIQVAAPKVFKGTEEGMWSPEELLLGALNSCIMTTFLFYAKREDLELISFESEVIGTVEIADGKLRFASIDVYPKIGVSGIVLKDSIIQLFEKTKEHCLISNSLNAPVYYHPVYLYGEKKTRTIAHLHQLFTAWKLCGKSIITKQDPSI